MARSLNAWRWALLGLLAITPTGSFPAFSGLPVFQQQVLPADDESAPDEDPKKAEEKKDEERKEIKKDPEDIRNTIGNLGAIRGLDQLKRPAAKGTWQKLIDQPYYTPAIRAKKLLFHGQYADAEAKFHELLTTEPANQEYIEGYAEAILRQGQETDRKRFDEKVAALTEAQRGTPKMVRLRAEALLARGKSGEARTLLKAFVDGHPKPDAADGDSLDVFMTYGQSLQDAAEYAAAIGIYGRLVDISGTELPDDSQAATALTMAKYHAHYLAGTGRSVYQWVLAQLAGIRERDQVYWPAMLAEAQVLLASHNNKSSKDGGPPIDEVLDLNPNSVEVRFLAVDQAIEQYNFDLARQQLDEIKRRTDVALADAYEGRLLLKERLPQQAVAPLLAAIKKNPQLAEARGWLAGAYYLLVDQGKMQEQLSAIKSPLESGLHPVVLYQAAEILRDARQYPEAEKLYKQTGKTAGWWSEPTAALAQLYLETGEEDKAREAYDLSFKIDPYNMRAYNQLKLLDYLQGFATKESKTRLGPNIDRPAFIIRYDPQDEILADLALQWMEKIRPEVWSYFQIQELAAPTQIEFFPSHEQFGVRTTGLPWIGTVGASTGNVIAMDVPRAGAKDLMGAFDWARVLRHEYTHTVTLAMTNNRIPHWLTEACACNQEEAPRDWEVCQGLAQNYRAGQLFEIANLNWGFIKPKRSIDRQLAYAQSLWLYQYLVGTYGLPKMLGFLHAFRDGATEAEAWQKIYGKSMPEMDKEFLAWAGKQIESWGLPSDLLPKQADLEAVVKKDPKDIASLVKLAYVLAGNGDGRARTYLEQALALDPKHVEARELLGAVLAQSKKKTDKDRAKTMLDEVVKDAPNRPVAVRTLGVLAMSAKDFDNAEKWFTQLQNLRPLDDASYTNLAGIYLVKKDYPKAIAQLLELQRHEQHDERIPRKLSALFLQQGQLAEARQSAYRSIRINPYNAINHETMAQVLMAENQPQHAIEYWADATILQPKVAEFWEGLAEAKGLSGDASGAAAAAKKSLELQPKSPAAKWLQEELPQP